MEGFEKTPEMIGSLVGHEKACAGRGFTGGWQPHCKRGVCGEEVKGGYGNLGGDYDNIRG